MGEGHLLNWSVLAGACTCKARVLHLIVLSVAA